MKQLKLCWAALFLAASVSAQTYTVLHNFTNSSDGAWPHCGLALSGGTLYGVTDSGGSSSSGTVFQVGTNGSNYSLLKTFTGSPDGSSPDYSLIVSNGVLYGTTTSSGTYGYGTVFKMAANGGGYQIVTNFGTYNPNNGSNPSGKLVLDGNMLYGVVNGGGVSNYGAIFKCGTDGTGFGLIKSFYLYDGWAPQAGLILYNGVLYGTTAQGGTNGGGTVFKINEDGSGYAVIRAFNGTDGQSPKGGVVAANGVLYGTTYNGNYGSGTLFRINIDGSGFTNLVLFNTTYGGSPWGDLVLDGNTLYGACLYYGGGSDGSIFKVNIDGSGFAVLHTFRGAEGANSMGDLLINNGVLYGTTRYGGSSSYGVAFSLTVPPPPTVVADAKFGVLTNSFGFSVFAPSNQPVAIDVCSGLGAGGWTPLQTNTLGAGTNTFYFKDTKWTNYPVRFYRVREP